MLGEHREGCVIEGLWREGQGAMSGVLGSISFRRLQYQSMRQWILAHVCDVESVDEGEVKFTQHRHACLPGEVGGPLVLQEEIFLARLVKMGPSFLKQWFLVDRRGWTMLINEQEKDELVGEAEQSCEKNRLAVIAKSCQA